MPQRLNLALLVLVAWCQFGPSHAANSLPVQNTIAQRLVACTVCHGKEGRATNDGYYPRIAGKPAGYLFNQLVNFRDGRRNNPAMAGLVDNLSDAYLRQIAEYFSLLDLPYPPPQSAASHARLNQIQIARARALVETGDPVRKIPACTQCHGVSLTGMTPGFPGLLGLPRDYLVAQIGAWQIDQRRALAPDCMQSIAKKLSAEEVGLLADWLSAQAVPVPSKPSSSIGKALPIECGGALR